MEAKNKAGWEVRDKKTNRSVSLGEEGFSKREVLKN